AGILVFMMIGAFAFAAQTVVVRGFYALQNTLFPAVFGTIAVVASIPLYVIGMRVMGARGVALAISVSVTLQVMLLFMIWNRQHDNKNSASVFSFLLKTVLLSIPLGIGMAWFRNYLAGWMDTATFSGCLLVAAIVGALFSAILVAAALLFKIGEIQRLIERMNPKNR
ncbi:MAG: lipid II flippase MurJ, partial [Thermodesulfobacteriota bacterium]|nr:lipid II flippase MurJ [Thermodesulfobacteriota bacterium]